MNQYSKQEIIQDVKELHQLLGRRPTKWDNERLNGLAKRCFGSWNSCMEESGYKVKWRQKVTLPEINNPSLYYFLGLVVTDGHVVLNKKEGYRISIYSSYEDEIKMIKELIEYLFQYKPSIYRKKKYGFNKRINIEIMINSKILVFFLQEKFNIPAGDKSLTLTLPNLPLDRSLRLAFLRGVIDGDGWINKDGIGICSGSQTFLEQLKSLCNNMGIVTSDVKQGNTCYRFYVRKRESQVLCQLLYNSADYFYKRKQKTWKKILNSH